jgi:hypothetical protein
MKGDEVEGGSKWKEIISAYPYGKRSRCYVCSLLVNIYVIPIHSIMIKISIRVS